MIDVHMLVLPGTDVKQKMRAIELVPEWCTLFVVPGVEGPIGPQRLAAMRLGKNPYVSCIDPDDWTEPNTFDVCLEALETKGYKGVCTRELTHDEFTGQTYLTQFKHKTFVLRRDWVEEREALYRFDMCDKDIVASPDVVWLPFLGHHWRRYMSAGKKYRQSLQTVTVD